MPNTLEENVNRVKAAKTAIANAITAKGGTVGANDGLEDFASDIATIPSGGVEFSNSPTSFSLVRNIINLDVIVPNGCTEIASGAFRHCTGLKTIEIPNSVDNIYAQAFEGCTNLETIYINKDENTITGSPWGAPNTTQIIWRTNRYQSSCTEVASGTTLTGTVNATVGDLVVATFEIFGSSYSISEGWTLLGDGTVTGSGNYSQKTGMAYKIATSTTETFTITQNTSTRAFINMVSITGASIGSFSGYTAQTDGLSITMNKPNGLTIWSASTVWWGTGWSISNIEDNANISTTRNLLSLDQSNSASVTFTNNEATSPSGILAASLTITGIDNFWYYDNP